MLAPDDRYIRRIKSFGVHQCKHLVVITSSAECPAAVFHGEIGSTNV